MGLTVGKGIWALLLLVLASCTKVQPELAETTLFYSQPKVVPKFSLTDQHGNVIGNAQLEGHWTWLFLGYTSCPDICPMTLAKLAAAKKQVKEKNVQVWFVSVDPNRDTQQKRADYAGYFGEGIVAATAAHEVLFPFVRSLGLIYAIGDTTQEQYAVDHSASIALINPKGELTAIFKPEFSVGQVPLVDKSKLVKDFDSISSQY